MAASDDEPGPNLSIHRDTVCARLIASSTDRARADEREMVADVGRVTQLRNEMANEYSRERLLGVPRHRSFVETKIMEVIRKNNLLDGASHDDGSREES